jgi:hypothetical protein
MYEADHVHRRQC